MNLITFLSDFGQSDGYTGSVKGMILSINPRVQIVDISHAVQPYRIEQGAYILASTYQKFPRETVHLAVVDPGVGDTQRRPIILKTAHYFFVGPDNGLFTFVMQKEDHQAYRIDLPGLKRLQPDIPVSPTFHARDIFGPVAALLAKEGSKLLNRLAQPLKPTPQMLAEGIRYDRQTVRVRVIMVDHFGNIITACSRSQLPQNTVGKIRTIKINDIVLTSVYHTYSDVQPGCLLALWNSAGFLEIAVNQGSAADKLGCTGNLEQVEIVLE
jgi:S-adenosylmethionine hydrolase